MRQQNASLAQNFNLAFGEGTAVYILWDIPRGSELGFSWSWVTASVPERSFITCRH